MTTKDDESTPRLEPCEHCGSPAKFEDGGFSSIRVACTVYECTQRQRVHKRDPNCYSKLAEHWNTRVAHDALVAERDALRKAIEPFAMLALQARPIGEIKDHLECSIFVDHLLAAHKAYEGITDEDIHETRSPTQYPENR